MALGVAGGGKIPGGFSPSGHPLGFLRVAYLYINMSLANIAVAQNDSAQPGADHQTILGCQNPYFPTLGRGYANVQPVAFLQFLRYWFPANAHGNILLL